MNDTINVRMYRIGTGDFFLLTMYNKKEMNNNLEPFKMMIDCGCIQGGKVDFENTVTDLATYTKNHIDLLVVTHEHADHINGFEKAVEIFDTIVFDEVWFSWTENKDDELANDLRQNHAELQKAISLASERINNINFNKYYREDLDKNLMIESRLHFKKSLNEINELCINQNLPLGKPKPTMEDLLINYKVIKKDTRVQFLEPGQLIDNIENNKGIRIFVLGPPKNNQLLKLKEKHGQGYEKREEPSTKSIAFLDALNFGEDKDIAENAYPFDNHYIFEQNNNLKKEYNNANNDWRNIDSDWLFSAGLLALRHETSINNTSLALAIQIVESEKVLLFPGDAEYGNWSSWHDGLDWNILLKNGRKKVNAEYLLNNTVFYKVGHHLSHNGTAKQNGLDMMTNDEFAAMVTLSFNKINSGWLNTMPSDIIGAELLRKTKGKLFFVGDRIPILKNIRTKRVSLNGNYIKTLNNLNKPFDNLNYIDYEVN